MPSLFERLPHCVCIARTCQSLHAPAISKPVQPLFEAGAIHAYPEAIESSLRLGATALRLLRIPTIDIDQMLQDIRDGDYQPVIETPVKEDEQ